MLSRRQMFAWIGGAAAAAATIPAFAKSQITALKAPPNPYYLTNFDVPRWVEGYEKLPWHPRSMWAGEDPNDHRPFEPLRVIGELQRTSNNPALDAAIDKALKGLV